MTTDNLRELLMSANETVWITSASRPPRGDDLQSAAMLLRAEAKHLRENAPIHRELADKLQDPLAAAYWRRIAQQKEACAERHERVAAWLSDI